MNVLCNPTDSPRRCLMVAELSSNHAGRIEKAAALLRAAAWSGADAVKLQFFTPEQMTLKSDALEFTITQGPWKGTLWDLYKKAQTPVAWAVPLLEQAHALNLACIATVYHPDMLEEIGDLPFDAWKVASYEIAYQDLFMALAKTGKPVLVSTGCATWHEIKRAVTDIGKDKIALLKCTSAYPAKLQDMNLATIPHMIQHFGVPVGLSDHSWGIVAPVVAVALGAEIVEKHLMLALDEDTLDAAFSVTPQQFRAMVETIRAAEAAIGQVSYEPTSLKYKRREYEGKWVRTVN